MKKGQTFKNFIIKLSNSLSDLVMLNAIFIVFSIAVVTIPAAITALFRTTYSLISGEDSGCNSLDSETVQSGSGPVGFETLFRKFKQCFTSNFLSSSIIGLVFSAVIGMCVFILLHIKPEGIGLPITAFTIFSLGAVIIMSIYSHSMISIIHLPVHTVIQNSFRLLFINFKNNMIAVAVILLLSAVQLFGFPFLVPFLFCFHFSLAAYFIMLSLKTGIDMCIDENE